MSTKKYPREKGQTLVLVVIGFLVFVAMMALVLDGGNAYAAKRAAQNAADAGALAGATYLCKHRNEDGVEAAAIGVAEEYGVLNEAVDPPQVFVNAADASVMVTATVTRTTFFAGVIGFDEVSPVAVAEAACRPPGVGVLPVAWSCRENVEGDLECVNNIGPCRPGDEYNNDPNDTYGLDCTYLIMDSVKVVKGHPCDPDVVDPLDPKYCYEQNDIVCAPNGDDLDPVQACDYWDPAWGDPSDPTIYIDCDVDNDCENDLMSGGARSWLDLDGGGGGAQELKDWITGAEDPPEIEVHTWVPEQSGVATSLFHTTADILVGKEIILPVFNKDCEGLPADITDPETNNACNAWTEDQYVDYDSMNSTHNFHIISFSAFHVTCVQTTKNKSVYEAGYQIGNHKTCYGHDAAVDAGVIDDNDKSIEGYFIRDMMGGYGGPGDWFDTGTFTVVLVR
jgi:Putative Flp pilus-assembly TadE/G-like